MHLVFLYLDITLQIASFVDSLKHTNIEVEWVPILLGGLFNAIGTPQVRVNVLK